MHVIPTLRRRGRRVTDVQCHPDLHTKYQTSRAKRGNPELKQTNKIKNSKNSLNGIYKVLNILSRDDKVIGRTSVI